MSRFLRPVIILILMAGVVSAPAEEFQDNIDSHYRLSDLVAMSLKGNPVLASKSATVDEKIQAGAQARAWAGPSLDLIAGRRKIDPASGPLFEAAVFQPLPWVGKNKLQGDLLNLQAESWRIQRAATETDIVLNVVRLSYEYTVNRRKAEFAEKRLKRFELINDYLSGRVFPTPQGRAERDIVQNRLKGLVADLLHRQAEFKTSLAKLKVYVPLPSKILPVITVPWLNGAKSLEEGECLAAALKNDPTLRLQGVVLKSAEMEKSLARKEGLPDPALLASFDQAKAGETEKNYGLGVSLAFPSWNQNRAGRRSAEQRMLAEEQLLSFEEQKLKANLPRALVEYEAARQVVMKFPQTIISELETQIQGAEKGFRKGQVDLLTFLELDGSCSDSFDGALSAQVELVGILSEIFAMTQEREILSRFESF
jgi:cobalt-zinc-cadmium efflux system outer membrane protein